MNHAKIEIIRIYTIFEFGRGRGLITPLLPLYRKYYWFLLAFGVLFWVVFMFLAYHFADLYPEG